MEQAYYKEYYPELAKVPGLNSLCISRNDGYTPINLSLKTNYYCVNKEWINALKNIDKKWFNKAEKINNARNKAAHSFDAQLILKTLGFSGKNAFANAKKECIELIDKLLGLKMG